MNLFVYPALRTETRASARGYVQATKPGLPKKAETAVVSVHLESQDTSWHCHRTCMRMESISLCGPGSRRGNLVNPLLAAGWSGGHHHRLEL